MKWKTILRNVIKGHPFEQGKKILKAPDQLMPENIYDGKTTHSMTKQHGIIHYAFKYRFLEPVIWIGDKILGRYAMPTVPDKPWNVNIKALDSAFEEALDDWVYKYYAPLKNWPLKTAEKFRREDRCIKILYILKKWYLTIALGDTAYRETHNCLMHSIAKHMFKAHKQENPIHVFYRSRDCYNPLYFALWDKLAEGKLEIRLANGKQDLRREGKSSATVFLQK